MVFNSSLNTLYPVSGGESASHILSQRDVRRGYILPGESQGMLGIVDSRELALRDSGRKANTLRYAEMVSESDSGTDSDSDSDSDEELTGGMRRIMRKTRRKARRRSIRELKRSPPDSDSDTDSDDSDTDSDSGLTGGGIKRFIKKVKRSSNKTKKKFTKAVHKLDKATKSKLRDQLEKTAYQIGDDIKRSATDKDGAIRILASEALDSVPEITGALGQAAGGTFGTLLAPGLGSAAGAELGQEIGEQAGSVGRQKIKDKTGYGKRPNVSALVGKYSTKANHKFNKATKAATAGVNKAAVQANKAAVQADKAIAKAAVAANKAAMQADHAIEQGAVQADQAAHVVGKRVASAAAQARRSKVAAVMKEHGMTLGAASKFIKEHGI